MPMPYFSKGQLFDLVREENKNHGEYPFKPRNTKSHDERKIDKEATLRLYFDNQDIVSVSEAHNIKWIVRFADINKPMTLSSLLLLNNERVAGVDANIAPVSFRYDNTTRRKNAYHHNIIKYDSDKILANCHVDLDIQEHYTDIYKFAEMVADLWKISYWKEVDLYE